MIFIKMNGIRSDDMRVQVKRFDAWDEFDKMNDFLKTIDVVDIKMNTVVAVTGNFYTTFLVIYKDDKK